MSSHIRPKASTIYVYQQLYTHERKQQERSAAITALTKLRAKKEGRSSNAAGEVYGTKEFAERVYKSHWFIVVSF